LAGRRAYQQCAGFAAVLACLTLRSTSTATDIEATTLSNALTTLDQSHRFLLEFKRVSRSCRHRHLRSPCVNLNIRRINEAMFAPDLLDRHAGFGLPQETNDLLFAVFSCSHVHLFSGLMDFLEKWTVRFMFRKLKNCQ
jgi:hypothetical protein